MISMVLVGGLGTFEGPIIGAVVLYLLQNHFHNNGVWYFVGLGIIAILFALFLPRGLWGTAQRPLRDPAATGRPPAAPSASRPRRQRER